MRFALSLPHVVVSLPPRLHSECRRHTICDILSSERNTPNLKFINHTIEEVGVTLTRCDNTYLRYRNPCVHPHRLLLRNQALR